MSDQNTADWLAAFQEEFSAGLRTPLNTFGGHLSASHPSNSGQAAYQRQYWFRLFTCLQETYPLTARLLGLWSFNLLSMDYLRAHPPTDPDISKIGHQLIPFLEAADVPPIIPAAARLDWIRHRVFMAPGAIRLTFATTSTGPALQLRAAEDWAIIEEHWALVNLCLRLPQLSGEEALPAPPPLGAPQYWLIRRQGLNLIHEILPPLQAQFYQLLTSNPLLEALQELDKLCPVAAKSSLPSSVQNWIALSIDWGLWIKAP